MAEALAVQVGEREVNAAALHTEEREHRRVVQEGRRGFSGSDCQPLRYAPWVRDTGRAGERREGPRGQVAEERARGVPLVAALEGRGRGEDQGPAPSDKVRFLRPHMQG